MFRAGYVRCKGRCCPFCVCACTMYSFARSATKAQAFGGELATRFDVCRQKQLVRGTVRGGHGDANSETPVEASAEVAGMRPGCEATKRHACAPLNSGMAIVWSSRKEKTTKHVDVNAYTSSACSVSLRRIACVLVHVHAHIRIILQFVLHEHLVCEPLLVIISVLLPVCVRARRPTVPCGEPVVPRWGSCGRAQP